MNLNSPQIKGLINEWQKELRKKTTQKVILVAIVPEDYRIPFEEMVSIICKVTSVPFEKAMARKSDGDRKNGKVLTRHLIAYYARKNYDYSYSLIGELLGGQDHTTIINATRKIRDLIESGDKVVCDAVVRINVAIEKQKIISEIQT
jgi:chromosomal replication initiation ATPase DnaA